MADSVAVHSKSNDDEKQVTTDSRPRTLASTRSDVLWVAQWVWQSSADSTFSVYEDDGEALGRGTKIVLTLKVRRRVLRARLRAVLA